MFEKVSKYHPDKLADRIAGALVDLAYSKNENPKVAIEVLLGHGQIFIINETDTILPLKEVKAAVSKICKKKITAHYVEEAQDPELAKNQAEKIRCGDNGIFKGVPTSDEEQMLATFTTAIDNKFPTDGKYILDNADKKLIICQSKATEKQITKFCVDYQDYKLTINPLGEWEGGINVDSGATNRKLGSDMGNSVTGGGLHGKDLSKADVSINILCKILAEKFKTEVTAKCAIGDENVVFNLKNSVPSKIAYTYSEVVKEAKDYIGKLGGFEKLAEYGLVR